MRRSGYRTSRLSREALRTIGVNVALSIGIKLVFLVVVLLGWGTMWMAVLADMGTSLLVTLYGLRLLGFRDPARAGEAVAAEAPKRAGTPAAASAIPLEHVTQGPASTSSCGCASEQTTAETGCACGTAAQPITLVAAAPKQGSASCCASNRGEVLEVSGGGGCGCCAAERPVQASEQSR
jgi:hypothetical protein